MRSFIKWPGGKRWLISKYRHIFPVEYNHYYEPFVGGGSAFFSLMPERATISDVNEDLINTYRVMARDPERLRELLLQHQEQHCNDYYYEVRANIPENATDRAARFIYLNRACFNGMYRVNRSGTFNVPIGSSQSFIHDIDDFIKYSDALRNTDIRKQDFTCTIRAAVNGDFIFADPPYATSDDDSFVAYNDKLFSWNDQKRLLNALIKAKKRGVIILLTNAFHHDIQEIYEEKQFYVQPVSRYCSISGLSAGRGKQKELLISTYPINISEV